MDISWSDCVVARIVTQYRFHLRFSVRIRLASNQARFTLHPCIPAFHQHTPCIHCASFTLFNVRWSIQINFKSRWVHSVNSRQQRMDLQYNFHLQVIKVVFIFWLNYLDSPHSTIHLLQSWCSRDCSQQLGKLYQSSSNNGIAINSIGYGYFILNRYLQEGEPPNLSALHWQHT